MSETKYFGQTDMGVKVFAIYRKRPADGIVYQEKWIPGTSSWEVTTYLMRLVTGGDCTLTEITFELAKNSFPEAGCCISDNDLTVKCVECVRKGGVTSGR